jgi:hypothetical protein
MNLVEGHVSFAIVINGDHSLSFTIVDRDGQWRGCTSAPGIVSTGVWHTLIAAHDGASEARIGFDANIVARNGDVLGPVRSVGPKGVAMEEDLLRSSVLLFRRNQEKITYQASYEDKKSRKKNASAGDSATRRSQETCQAGTEASSRSNTFTIVSSTREKRVCEGA